MHLIVSILSVLNVVVSTTFVQGRRSHLNIDTNEPKREIPFADVDATLSSAEEDNDINVNKVKIPTLLQRYRDDVFSSHLQELSSFWLEQQDNHVKNTSHKGLCTSWCCCLIASRIAGLVRAKKRKQHQTNNRRRKANNSEISNVIIPPSSDIICVKILNTISYLLNEIGDSVYLTLNKDYGNGSIDLIVSKKFHKLNRLAKR